MRFGFLTRKSLGAAALLAAATLAACTVVVEEPVPPPRPGPGPICTREYAPVCGERGRDRQTFANACLARAAGYRIQYPGSCRGFGPGPGPQPPIACTREYAPVCARRGPAVRTFGNACEARARSYHIIHGGPCR